MLAFSIDYYGMIFRATQSVELFCAYFGTCMSKFTTVSTNNSNGTYNMSKALKSFNQVIIQPGQTISFFGIAGPCGKAEGYLPAGVVGGIGYVGALDVLCGVAPTVLLVEEDMLLSEVHGG